jgi:hypothetical protein
MRNPEYNPERRIGVLRSLSPFLTTQSIPNWTRVFARTLDTNTSELYYYSASASIIKALPDITSNTDQNTNQDENQSLVFGLLVDELVKGLNKMKSLHIKALCCCIADIDFDLTAYSGVPFISLENTKLETHNPCKLQHHQIRYILTTFEEVLKKFETVSEQIKTSKVSKGNKPNSEQILMTKEEIIEIDKLILHILNSKLKK